MKIIHFILGKANPNRMNGVNKVVNNLASTQHTLGFDVEVWGITDRLVHDYPTRNYKTRLFKKSKNPFYISKDIRVKLKNTKAIFHFHGGFIPQYYTMSRILKTQNFNFILTSHGSYNKEALAKNKTIKKWYFKLIEQSIIKKAKQIHFIGESEYNYISTKIVNVNKVLIPNGQESIDIKRKSENDKLIFGFCGRINIHVKGLDILFKGYSEFIKTTAIIAELWIIGGGNDVDKLHQLACDYDIQHAVKFFGSKYGEEKNELIAQMDYFCHTSRYEGLPTAVLEAAALSVPSIVSKETNMGAYLEKYQAGIVLDNNTPKNLKGAFKKAVKQSTQKRVLYRSNALHMINTAFSWKTICNRLATVYFS